MNHPADGVGGDAGDVAHGGEVAAPKRAVIARGDGHRDDAELFFTRSGNQDRRLEHEMFRRQVDQFHRTARIPALAALGIGHRLGAGPGNAPVGHRVGAAAALGLLLAIEQARADHDVLGMARGGRDDTRNIGRQMLAVAVHGQHRVEALPQRFAKPAAQCFALAAPLRVTQQGHRHGRNDLGGAIARTVIHHDHFRTQRQHRLHHRLDRLFLVEAGNQHAPAGAGGDHATCSAARLGA